MEDMLTQIFDHLLAWVDTHGAWAAAALAGGMLIGPKAVPLLRKVACRTPTKLDDIAVNMLEMMLRRQTTAIEQLTASELDKIITTPVLVELVRLRKTRINEAKAGPASKVG